MNAVPTPRIDPRWHIYEYERDDLVFTVYFVKEGRYFPGTLIEPPEYPHAVIQAVAIGASFIALRDLPNGWLQYVTDDIECFADEFCNDR